jgi:hypothetical protein
VLIFIFIFYFFGGEKKGDDGWRGYISPKRSSADFFNFLNFLKKNM